MKLPDGPSFGDRGYGTFCPYLECADNSNSLAVLHDDPLPQPYEKLGNDEIRLLRISSGDPHDPLTTALCTVKLGSAPPYEALSYCWHKSITKDPVTDPDTEVELGIWSSDKPLAVDASRLYKKPDQVEKLKFKDLRYHPKAWHTYYQQGGIYPSKVVKCGSSKVEVGGELFVALKALRKETEDRLIWIDALCINQADYNERSQQVQLMGIIYEQAARVIVWLGEMFSDVEEAPATLAQLAHRLVPLWKAEQEGMDHLSRMLEIERFKADPEVRALHWDSLAELLKRGWFERVWCIQEIVKAKSHEAIVKVGYCEIPWTVFAMTVSSLRRFDIDSFLWSKGECEGTQALSTIMDLVAAPTDGLPLLQLLEKTRSFKSTLPSDKFFSMLTFASDKSERGISVNYNLDPVVVYKSFARSQLERERSPDVLYHCCFSSRTTKLELPSWVPNWTQPMWHTPLNLYDINFAASSVPTPDFYFEDDTLYIKGKMIDVVSAVENKRDIPRQSQHAHRFDRPDDKGVAPWKAPLDGDMPWWNRAHDNKGWWESSHEKWFWDARNQRREWMHNAIAVAFPTGACTAQQMEDLWRTFIFDRLLEGPRPTSEWGDVFMEWIVDVSGTMEEVKALHDSERLAMDFRDIAGYDEKQKNRVAFGRASARAYNRRFYRSKSGRFGWGVDGMALDDVVCILDGCSIPLIMRPDPSAKDRFRIIGDTYLHGVMYENYGPSENYLHII